MLDIVRNLVSSIFGKILLGIMVLSFALWGVGDILTSGNSQLAAKVGNEKITLDEFYNEFQKTVSLYNQQTSSSINLKEAKDLQLHNILLNDLIYSRMVKDYANKQNIFINDASLKIIITSLPQFKNADGLFSETKYKNYIFNNFPNEEVFLNEIMDSLSKAKITKSSSSDNLVNKINNEEIQLSFDQPIGFLSEIIFNDNAAFIYSISDKKKSFIPEFSMVKDEVVRDYIENEKKSRISSMADKILIDLQFKGIDKFEEYAKLNSIEIKELNDLKRNDENISKDSLSSIFNIGLEDNVKIIMNNDDIGIGALKKITKPDSYISDTYYSEVENNIIQNFNSSLESIIGQKIIDNTDYEVYSQNIDKLFM